MIFKVDISSNYLKVFLTVTEEENVEKQKPVSVEDIIGILKEKKVTYGINKDAINKLNGSIEPIRDLVIVEGKAPTPGNPAEVHVSKKCRCERI